MGRGKGKGRGKGRDRGRDRGRNRGRNRAGIFLLGLPHLTGCKAGRAAC